MSLDAELKIQSYRYHERPEFHNRMISVKLMEGDSRMLVFEWADGTLLFDREEFFAISDILRTQLEANKA